MDETIIERRKIINNEIEIKTLTVVQDVKNETTVTFDKFKNKLVMCPYCPPKPRASHRTACFRVMESCKGLLQMKCVACNKTFQVQTNGEYILKTEYLMPIEKIDVG